MTLADRLMPALRCLDPETAHSLALMALSMGLAPPVATAPRPILKTRVWGMEFTNPVGLAAGFDKDARVPQAVLGLGFGFTEVGSVTPKPQLGNPKPRLFRLTEDRAVINRMGFNNGGHDAMAARLSKFRAGSMGLGIAGVNLGRNKDSSDEVQDYVLGVERLGAMASYLVVNVSSPNTPGLRTLQDRGPLTALLTAVKAARDGLANRPPLLVKIAPDLASADLEDIAAVAADVGIDGIIATNTTISRPAGLRDSQKGQIGGLSGAPLKAMAKSVISDLYQLVGRDIPLIGVGGIATGADAYARIRAGASLVQIYSALVFEGPYLAARIAAELADLLERDGFKSVAAAVGADHR
ncbi:quinone-dependent dihydroorotate dehydrogenase [bacterium SCSIO 12827]|nr:quinone-dependent dihydroorotate dehydrogenase [bacterium SCSIO 12827]